MIKKFYNTIFNIYTWTHKDQILPIEKLEKIPKNILVISNTALGDTLLSTPAIKSLKQSFPKSQIIALIHKNYLPLFQNFPYIDHIISYHGGHKRFFSTIRKIKNFNPDITLIFHGNGPQDIQLAMMSGCRHILKHPTKTSLKRYLSFDFPKKRQHTIEDRLDILRLIGAKKLEKEMTLSLPMDRKSESKFKKYHGAVGFQVGAADRYKRWPIERFIELAKKIEGRIVLTGVQSEYSMSQKIVDSIGRRVINLCGQCSIQELPYLIKQLRFLITNDTGTMHLAIALKTPTISLFSATRSEGIGPYQDHNLHSVIQKDGCFIQKLPKKKRDDSAMRLIGVEEVYQKYKELNEILSL